MTRVGAAAGRTAGVRVDDPRAPRRARFAWAVGALLVLALVLGLGDVAATPDYRIVHDAHDYDLHARSIASGDGFARIGPGPTRRTAFRPPGYPVFLAGVYALGGREWTQTRRGSSPAGSPTRSWARRSSR